MASAIIVYEGGGHIYPFTARHDIAYDTITEKMHKFKMNFLAGKKGIADNEIDSLSERIREIVKRCNKDNSLDARKELEAILQ